MWHTLRMAKSYPPLRMQVLSALLELKDGVIADPEFLDSPDIPYDGEILTTLKKILAPTVRTVTIDKTPPKAESAGRGRPSKDVVLGEEDQAKIRDQLQKLMDQLDQMGDGEKDMPTNEKLQVIRLKTNLTEQLLKQQERAFNVKRMSQFKEVIIGILDDLVSEKDREVFTKRLEPYRS